MHNERTLKLKTNFGRSDYLTAETSSLDCILTQNKNCDCVPITYVGTTIRKGRSPEEEQLQFTINLVRKYGHVNVKINLKNNASHSWSSMQETHNLHEPNC